MRDLHDRILAGVVRNERQRRGAERGVVDACRRGRRTTHGRLCADGDCLAARIRQRDREGKGGGCTARALRQRDVSDRDRRLHVVVRDGADALRIGDGAVHRVRKVEQHRLGGLELRVAVDGDLHIGGRLPVGERDRRRWERNVVVVRGRRGAVGRGYVDAAGAGRRGARHDEGQHRGGGGRTFGDARIADRVFDLLEGVRKLGRVVVRTPRGGTRDVDRGRDVGRGERDVTAARGHRERSGEVAGHVGRDRGLHQPGARLGGRRGDAGAVVTKRVDAVLPADGRRQRVLQRAVD